MALDINHTISCETSVRPSANPGTSPQGQSQAGTHSGTQTRLGDPLQSCSTARLSSGQHWDLEEAAVTWRKPLSLSPGGARVALLGQGCTHEHSVPLAWSRVQLLTKHKLSQRGIQVPCNPVTSFALCLQSQGLTHRKLGRSQVGCPGCRGHRNPPSPMPCPPHSAAWCQAGPASAADGKDLCQATSSSAIKNESALAEETCPGKAGEWDRSIQLGAQGQVGGGQEKETGGFVCPSWCWLPLGLESSLEEETAVTAKSLHRGQMGHQPSPSTRAGPAPPAQTQHPELCRDREEVMPSKGRASTCTPRPKRGRE